MSNEEKRVAGAPDADDVQRALVQQWNVPLGPEERDWETMRRRLAERVRLLLEHDLNRLMSALYLLDVPEGAYRRAVAAPRNSDAAMELADAILRREVEKSESRRRYAK